MAVFNGANYLETQLASIYNQTVPPKEIIVVDDHSCDSSIEVVRRISARHANVKTVLIENELNLGYIKTFETGIRLVSTEFILFSDQDDFWFDDKAEVISRELIKRPSADLVLHDVIFANEHLHPSRITKFEHLRALWLTKKSFVQGSAMAVRRDIALKALPFKSACGHDNQVKRMASNVVYIDSPLMLYRRHNDNSSVTYLNDYLGGKYTLRMKVLLFRLKRFVNYNE
jgi:glycosyltransferase involved in cell wall biosynthesis